MSSATGPAKHSSEGDAPSPKKAKVGEKEALNLDKNNVENNNGTANLDSNDVGKQAQGGSSATGDNKTSNGNDEQQPEHDEHDGEELIGEGLDSDLEPFDPKVTRRLQSVESIQQQISKLNELASEEILRVEQKFNKLRRPHFEQRNALLKDVPNFWVTCLANHPSVTHLIENAEDEDCLHYLVNLDVEELEDIKSGYNLKFHFKENPYIKNDLIVRELRHLNSDEVESKSTPIEYKDTPQGRSLKNRINNNAVFIREREQFSFFAWLCLPCENGSDDIAEIIKDQIWPSPLEFFLQAPVDDYDGNSDDDEDDESDEDDYDDEDFENDNEAGLPEDHIPDEDIEGEELDDEDDDGDGDDDNEDEDEDEEDEE